MLILNEMEVLFHLFQIISNMYLCFDFSSVGKSQEHVAFLATCCNIHLSLVSSVYLQTRVSDVSSLYTSYNKLEVQNKTYFL